MGQAAHGIPAFFFTAIHDHSFSLSMVLINKFVYLREFKIDYQ